MYKRQGVEYEYQVIKSLPAFPYGNGKPNFGTGYLSSGIKKPAVHYRGSVLVVIDSTYKSLLAPEILRLLQDLEEDGWQSFSLYVDRNDKVTNVKSKIKTWACLLYTSQYPSGGCNIKWKNVI